MALVHIHITGIVQGVGMRPFVYRTAMAHGISGWVLNAGDGVHIEASAENPSTLDAFVRALRDEAPAAARIDGIEVVEHEGSADDAGADTPQGATPEGSSPTFRIVASDDETERTTLVSPDIATCPDCLRELFDPADRRYHYPFINCTNCGPRFTIIRSLPYDRPATSMDAFPMCPACATEYADPADRRFHAQPNACFSCGPHITWREKVQTGTDAWERRGGITPAVGTTRQKSDAIIERCVEMLAAGGIVAIKGLGGFHLACDASNEHAVRDLRRRKRRSNKPLAVMVGDIEGAQALCTIDEAEAELLTGSIRPIVLLRRRKQDERDGEWGSEQVKGGSDHSPKGNGSSRPEGDGSDRSNSSESSRPSLAPSVAFDLPELGIMLPYTPLQHLLLAACAARGVHTLVMTSGNVSEEPIETDDGLAWAHLVEGGLADALLGNNRAILTRYDDSVIRVIDGQAMPVRRARGYAPQPLDLPPCAPSEEAQQSDGPRSDIPCILACGPEQKATIALTREQPDGSALCFVSQHIGDVENGETFDAWHEARHRMSGLFELEPHALACDLHPTYLSSQWARAEASADGRPLIEVQHHHAHIASVIAEMAARGIIGPAEQVLGIALDGTGAGTDGTVWGGEVMIASLSGFTRMAHLKPWRLPAGMASVRDARRNAFSLLHSCELLDHPGARMLVEGLSEAERAVTVTMIERGLNSPLTSSMGRLLDAMAAMLGICLNATYEGEPAIMLEAAAWRALGTDDARRAHDRADGFGYRFSMHEQPVSAPDEQTRQRRSRVGEHAIDQVIELDPTPMARAALDDLMAGRPVEAIAADVHFAVAQAVCDASIQIARRSGIRNVALSGGVFMNRLLLGEALQRLRAEGLRPLVPSAVPVNDGCIAFGQAAVARARLCER